MLVGLLAIAVISGLFAAGLALMLGMAAWAAILAYCVTGSMAALVVAVARGGVRRSAYPHTPIVPVAVPTGK